MQKMTYDQFVGILEKAGVPTDFEYILNTLSGYYNEKYLQSPTDEMSEIYRKRGSIIFDELWDLGYFDRRHFIHQHILYGESDLLGEVLISGKVHYTYEDAVNELVEYKNKPHKNGISSVWIRSDIIYDK